jgi:lipopolysaccharide/colanic/teichoic acid biosynthesis glycosyltransferase
MIKQILEISLTVFALIFFSPIMILISFLIWLEDQGEVFFFQERIGLREVPFEVFKFRTMKDGKVTKVGSFLRKTGLDELAQLFNILAGDMSIVGPRPLTRFDIQRLGWNQYRYIKRWSVKPGLTGLAQIYAGKSASISYCFDLYFIQNKSSILEIKIIALTFMMNLLGKRKIRNWLYKQLQFRKSNYTWNLWKNYFYFNSSSKSLDDYKDIDFSLKEKQALYKSLAIFQLGEAGEGRIAKEIDSSFMYGINKNYKQCIKMFVKEEGNHARILGNIIRSLGGKLIRGNWTEKFFSTGRRFLGIRLKLLVLLIAETISILFYKFYIQKLPLSGIRASLIKILKDEEMHLQFHQQFFLMRIKRNHEKLIFRLLWRVLSFLAFHVVYLDHRKYLNVFNFNYSSNLSEYWKLIEKVEIGILQDSKNNSENEIHSVKSKTQLIISVEKSI